MKRFIEQYWKTVLFFVVVGLVGGFFTGLYTLDSYPAEMQQLLLEQGITRPILGLVSAVQSAGYALFCGVLGIFLGKKTGLWRDERILENPGLKAANIVAIVGGMVLILSDLLLFGPRCQVIMDSYAVKPTVPYMLAAVLYGGVIEEVMLRLFFMSLITFILFKLFGKKSEKPSTTIVVSANVVAALLFAASHLPTTAATMGLTPMIVFRCFLLNGTFGLLFGRLYRKHGLRYAMLGHAGAHFISKLIWILFV
jgi:hypothetical protein